LSEKERKGELTIETIEKKSKSLTNHSTTKQTSEQVIGLNGLVLVEKKDRTMTKG